MINQKDIAKRLGLSIMTVSRALRDHPDLSEMTKARVVQKALEMGYRKSEAPARKVKQSTRVAVLAYESRLSGTPLFETDVPHSIFVSLQKECRRQGVETIVEFPESGQTPLSVKNGSARAVFLFGRYTAEDVALVRHLPILAVSSFIYDKELPRIVADNDGGMIDVTEHLIQMGHRNILFLGIDEQKTELYRARGEGYAVAMARHGLTARALFVDHRAIDRYLNELQGFTAIACSCDSMATALMDVLQPLGQLEKYSIAGFDNLITSEPYGLTSYQPDWNYMGRIAAKMLISHSEEYKNTGVKIVVPGKLIARRSTRPISI